MSTNFQQTQDGREAGVSATCRSSRSQRAIEADAPFVDTPKQPRIEVSESDPASRHPATIRMLRLAQVRAVTGLGKTKIYELQAGGAFPMRVKLTAHSVAWVESEVQMWLAARINASEPLIET